ncbi:MAG: protozoan/cyanobacterial globin family protein [Rhodospirillales bacterium]|nr:protozoan/cyanobacterial globin family protein [Rhodospirillales bacterium]
MHLRRVIFSLLFAVLACPAIAVAREASDTSGEEPERTHPLFDRSMKDTHAGLNLHDSDFNALVEDLEASMDARDIPWRTPVRLLAILAPIERDVVKQ